MGTSALEPSATSPLPDKPSLAVLPFENLSDDAEEEYFADGLTDDLITDLSKISGLFVIARNSVFAYKDQAVDVPEVARELGVRYVLEGSVRRAGERVRINAQLIDGTTGGHVWAERYDRDYADIFAVQDQVIEEIVGALSVQLDRIRADAGRPACPRAASRPTTITCARSRSCTVRQERSASSAPSSCTRRRSRSMVSSPMPTPAKPAPRCSCGRTPTM